MSGVDRFITPGLDDVRAGYEHIRALGVDAPTAADWLIDHVRSVTRDDLNEQVTRARGRAPVDSSTDTEHQRMRRALKAAVQVYNRQRARLTEFDTETGHFVTKSGAAAVNRAAVLRELRAPKEAPAFLGRTNPHVVLGGKNVKGFEVAGRLHISGAGLRAFVAYFTAQMTGEAVEATVRLDDFQVIH